LGDAEGGTVAEAGALDLAEIADLNGAGGFLAFLAAMAADYDTDGSAAAEGAVHGRGVELALFRVEAAGAGDVGHGWKRREGEGEGELGGGVVVADGGEELGGGGDL
jgi:hypothetical protein